MSKGEGGEIALFQNVKTRLRTLEGAKEFYAEVLEAYADNLISERSMRAIIYAMSNYLPYLKFEKETEIEKRIEALEKIIEGGN